MSSQNHQSKPDKGPNSLMKFTSPSAYLLNDVMILDAALQWNCLLLQNSASETRGHRAASGGVLLSFFKLKRHREAVGCPWIEYV